MSITWRKMAEGRRYTICEILQGSRSEVEAFFGELPKQIQSKIVKRIEFIAEKGPPRNREKFAHEDNGIYAIKEHQIRIYCFFDEGSLILLTHGVKKKRQRARPQDLQKAERLRDEYLKAKKGGS